MVRNRASRPGTAAEAGPARDEYELKLALTPEQLDALSGHPVLNSRAQSRTAARRLVSTYFDTPDGLLRERSIALRVRRDGRRRTQTVKVPGDGPSGLQHFAEHEARIDGDLPRLDRVRDPALRALFETTNLAERIGPVFTTDFLRQTYMLRQGESEIELALDRGEIRAGSAAQPICEAELELVSGRPAEIYKLALELLDTVPFRLELRTKAARGHHLAANRGPEPVRAAGPALSPAMGVAAAFTAIAYGCSEQIRANEAAVIATVDPEGVHQMRVGIRRLRAAVQTFRPCLDPEAHAFLKADLGWLQKALGPARDWDVLLFETLRAVERRLPDERCLAALGEIARQARASAYQTAHAAIRAPRYARLLLRLNLGLEDGSLFARPAGARGGPAAPGIMAFAAAVLARRHKQVLKAGRGHTRLSTERLHRLRIEAKKLRYAAEFFRPLYPPNRVKAFVDALSAIQDALGSVNDARVARSLLGDSCAAAPNAPLRDDALGERALGIVLGWQAARIGDGMRRFRAAWKTYAKAAPFWT